jgi:DnaJ-class molecular chaperone
MFVVSSQGVIHAVARGASYYQTVCGINLLEYSAASDSAVSDERVTCRRCLEELTAQKVERFLRGRCSACGGAGSRYPDHDEEVGDLFDPGQCWCEHCGGTGEEPPP